MSSKEKTEDFRIKQLLEMYQEDLLKIEHRSMGEAMRLRVEISEIINELNKRIGDFIPVLAYEIDNQYVGVKIGLNAKYPEKTSEEIINSIESQLCTTNLASYCLNPIMMGLWELKKRVKE